MIQKCIAAFTVPPPDAYPEYVSINERDNKIVVTVRGKATPYPGHEAEGWMQCGPVVDAEMSREQFAKLLAEACTNFNVETKETK